MRPILLLLLILTVAGGARANVVSHDPAATPAGHYVLDKEHASIVLRVRHMGFSRYTMRFNRLDSAFTYDPLHPEATQVSAEIEAESLDAGPNRLGKQFANQFLDAEANPKIVFVSKALKLNGDGTGVLTGELTLRGVTRPVDLNVLFNGVGPGLLAGHRVGFSATGTLRRSDFGSTLYLPNLVGDDVDFEIEVEFYKK